MAYPFGERPERPDVFVSPCDSRHVYTVHAGEVDESAVDVAGFTSVTILTPDGATSYSPDTVAADKLKLRPRLGKTGRQIVIAANFNWALAENDRGGANG